MENNLIKVENGVAILDTAILNAIVQFEQSIKQLKEKEDDLKARILEEMEAKDLIKVDTDKLLITYIAPTERETLDTKRLKTEQPDLYDEYIRFSPVKSSIRLKLKE